MAVVSYDAVGRRKTSVARVRLVHGSGKIIVNNRDLKIISQLKHTVLI